MSLKAFHVFFISLAILLSVGCSVWAFVNEAGLALGVGFAVLAVALVIYELAFVKKAKRIIT